MALKLIPDWKLAWRFLSVQAATLLAVLSGIQADVLPIIQPLFAPEQWPYVSGGLALLVILLRTVAQPQLETQRLQIDLDELERQMTDLDALTEHDLGEQGWQKTDDTAPGGASALIWIPAIALALFAVLALARFWGAP